MSLRAARAPIILLLAALLTSHGAPPALAGGITIRIGDRVDPATITIAPGTSVTFHNVDDDRHRMRTRAEPDFDTGDLEPGERSTVTFRTPGRYPYVDERDRDDARYHGTIVVRAAGSGGDGAGGGAAGHAGGSATGTAPVTIGMAGRAFAPADVTVTAGTRITFLNDDDDDHTATEREGRFDTGVLPPGASDTVTLAAGTYAFLCAIHPEMTGRIVVTGGSGGTPGTPPATPRPTPAPTPPPTPAPDTGPDGTPGATVSLVDFAFDPITVELEAGGTLTARNDGAAIHTVTAFDESVDSGVLQPGAVFQATFDTPGTFPFLCSLHPAMTLEVRVLARSVGVAPPGGPVASTAPSVPAAPSPSPAASPSAAAPASPPAEAQAAAPGTRPVASPGPAAAADTDAFGRLLLVVLLVGVACVAFARVLGGSLRVPRGS